MTEPRRYQWARQRDSTHQRQQAHLIGQPFKDERYAACSLAIDGSLWVPVSRDHPMPKCGLCAEAGRNHLADRID